jgi:hypothetical protein
LEEAAFDKVLRFEFAVGVDFFGKHSNVLRELHDRKTMESHRPRKNQLIPGQGVDLRELFFPL